MSNLIKLHELDCIFLSYDEPNAEYNYSDLLSKAPWAKRVHGVKGSDAAHKACADISNTEHFITVDGDNIVDPKFFDLEMNLDDFPTKAESQLSWSGRNHINGLVYGNGGLKCWTREHVWDMRTHEAADDDTNQVDFCWDPRYHHVSGCYSVVHNNASPLQAWRAGFREGVKMSLLSGVKLTDPRNGNFKKQLPHQNLQRLLIWMSIGQDVKNGDWAIYGARLGCYMTNCTDWDYTQVRDFDYLNQLFEEQKHEVDTHDKLQQKIIELGVELTNQLKISFADFTASQSVFYKETNVYLPRSNQVLDSSSNFITDIKLPQYYDLVFISNGEPHAEENYQRVLDKTPIGMKVHRVNNVNGIMNSHRAAAQLSNTAMFFVADADAWIVDNFQFPTMSEVGDPQYNYIYHAINPINYLCYGHGAIKIFPKSAFDDSIDSYVDMTTTVGQGVNVISVVSNIHKFNTDSFSTWRSAFRECAKLASKSIDGQVDNETQYRLSQWTNIGQGDYAAECLRGALAGRDYGLQYSNDFIAMQKINDYEFLKTLFERENR